MTRPHPTRQRTIARVLHAGTMGGLAMIPVGFFIRHRIGSPLNVYGELVVEHLLGRAVPWALFLEHMLISWIFAVPLVLLLRNTSGNVARISGLAYGVTIWIVGNSLLLPWVFARPTPWTLGWFAIWPSLTVHAVYGVVVGHALGQRPRTPQRTRRAQACSLLAVGTSVSAIRTAAAWSH